MHGYATYIHTLDALLESAAWGRRAIDSAIVHPHLNGGAAIELRKLVPRPLIRRSGAFFTDEMLGLRLTELAAGVQHDETPAWDPNCGAGDLLLRWSERLSIIDKDLRATLSHWGGQLHGIDIHPEFIQVAKRRLALAAISRGAVVKRGRITHLDQFLPNLQCRNLLRGGITVPDAAVVLMNPPFTMIKTPKSCTDWSSGKVAFAAVAFLDCLRTVKIGQQVLAILPDVLRSGSRYERWRKLVSLHASAAEVHVIGKFNDHADVDVFILHATAGRSKTPINIAWFQSQKQKGASVLGDFCDIRVGTVVPHRHEPTGKMVAYLTTSTAPPWREIRTIAPTLRHNGTCVVGPFLAVRRTSSPSDNSRAIGTVVNTKVPTAVENHLISIRPHDGRVETCRRLCDHLQSDQVHRWLNRRIRCRHLTVKAISAIPLPASFKASRP